MRDWELVGRGPLINEIDRRLADPSCTGVILTGYPGVGKRRIMAEIRTRWERRNRHVVFLVGVAGTSAIPFGALAPVLDDEATIDPADDAVGSLRVVRAARRALAGSVDRPALVEVVDISQLDTRSAGVVGQLLAERRIRLLASERSSGDVAAVVDRFDGVVEIPVPILDDESMGHLVDAALDRPAAPDLRRRLVSLSGGIPFNLAEILDQSFVDEAIVLDEGVYVAGEALPRSARLNRILIGQLDRLSPDQRLVIDALAVAGRLDAESLTAMTSLEAVEALERRGIVQMSVGGDHIGVTLTRPLTRDVAVENIGPLRMRALRSELVRRLTETSPVRGDEIGRALELRLDAGEEPDEETLLAEAKNALRRGEYDRAQRFALAIESRTGDATFEVRQVIGEVLSTRARFEEADRAIAGAAVSSDEDRLTRHVLRGDYLFWGLDLDAGEVAVRLADDELPHDESLRAVCAALVETRRIASGHLGALRDLDRIASSAGRRSRRVRAHHVYGSSVAAAMAGRSDEARRLALDGSAEGLGDPASLADRHPDEFGLLHAFADMVGGELERARAMYRRGHDACAEVGALAALAWYATGLVRLGPLDGDLGTAARLGARVARIGADLAIPIASQMGRSGHAVALAMLGRADEAAAALDGVPSSRKPVFRFEVERARGWVHVAHGETSRAIDSFESAAALAESHGLVHHAVLARLDLVRLGDGAAQASQLTSHAATSEGVFIPAVADAALAVGGRDGSALMGVVARFEEMGALLVAAEMAAIASDLHRGAHDAKAAAVCEHRALGLRARIDRARTPAFGRLSGHVSLTDREREVAELAARGRRNADIAGELFLSVRTVENHLQRTYRKLGIDGRDALADTLGVSPAATPPE